MLLLKIVNRNQLPHLGSSLLILVHAACYIRVSKKLCTTSYHLSGTRTIVEGPFFSSRNTDEKALKPNPGNDKSRDIEDGGDDNMDVSIYQTGKRESADDDEVSSESDEEATETPRTSTPKGHSKKQSLL